ncbi:MAG TPA: four helix bundle protein [bacterium]|nr:four helix bundle protein [bacterium]
MAEYIKLGDFEIYRKSLKIAELSWSIYQKLDWQCRKIIGDQFIRSADSIAANIAEGYGRFHYLDRIKFYYNSRGSLLETKHWAFTLKIRKFISEQEFQNLLSQLNIFHLQLNIFIKTTYSKK